MHPLDSDLNKKAVIFFGMTASGKSFLAKAWSQRHNFAYLNTDIIRKALPSIKSQQPTKGANEIGQGIYSSDFTRLTYDTILESAQNIIENDDKQLVVLDGSYMQQKHRDALRLKLGAVCQCVFVLCFCSEQTTRKRLLLRSSEAEAVSDGTLEVYLHQKEKFEPPTELDAAELIRLDTDTSVDNSLALLDKILLSA